MLVVLFMMHPQQRQRHQRIIIPLWDDFIRIRPTFRRSLNHSTTIPSPSGSLLMTPRSKRDVWNMSRALTCGSRDTYHCHHGATMTKPNNSNMLIKAKAKKQKGLLLCFMAAMPILIDLHCQNKNKMGNQRSCLSNAGPVMPFFFIIKTCGTAPGPNLSPTRHRRAILGHYIRGDVKWKNR
jgi:hypothetical protein